MKTVTNQIQGT
uniref:Uncharacterized protein n=1 Tax=Arundo donax TaxID=35708 RepID=A0A0A9B4T1_ARUDO